MGYTIGFVLPWGRLIKEHNLVNRNIVTCASPLNFYLADWPNEIMMKLNV